jgi:hypothetical protein
VSDVPGLTTLAEQHVSGEKEQKSDAVADLRGRVNYRGDST